MYIFVLQWPPAIKKVLMASQWSIDNVVPFGKIFSCFMACCLLGTHDDSNIRFGKGYPDICLEL